MIVIDVFLVVLFIGVIVLLRDAWVQTTQGQGDHDERTRVLEERARYNALPIGLGDRVRNSILLPDRSALTQWGVVLRDDGDQALVKWEDGGTDLIRYEDLRRAGKDDHRGILG